MLDLEVWAGQRGSEAANSRFGRFCPNCRWNVSLGEPRRFRWLFGADLEILQRIFPERAPISRTFNDMTADN